MAPSRPAVSNDSRSKPYDIPTREARKTAKQKQQEPSIVTPLSWRDPHLNFDPTRLPPLLEIPSDELRKQAVRHNSFHVENGRLGKDPLPRYKHEMRSYEVLETTGDAHLNGLVSRALRQRYPDLASGEFVELRNRLIRNDTLAHIALAYGLPSRLEHSTSHDLDKSQSVGADMFEAHLGALVEDKQIELSKIDEWLFKVFSPKVWTNMEQVADDLRRLRIEKDELRLKRLIEIGKTAKSQSLETWTCEPCDSETDSIAVKPNFVYTYSKAKGWHAQLLVGDEMVSCGHGSSKKEASLAVTVNLALGLRRAGELRAIESTCLQQPS
ncbi:ribonuclease III domain-containing protein [Sporobolomyces salmoneus]|uniref:ribonuclease III domain-containing protein n=1 Tax=Sporobolomyces salmoneus TaxID=183962 RepID=UPI00317A48F9